LVLNKSSKIYIKLLGVSYGIYYLDNKKGYQLNAAVILSFRDT